MSVLLRLNELVGKKDFCRAERLIEIELNCDLN